MKKFVAAILVLLLPGMLIKAQTLKISPDHPRPGDTVTISYTSFDDVLEKQVKLHFTYSNFYEFPRDINLKRQNNEWVTFFRIPDYAVYATFVIVDHDSTVKPGEKMHYSIPVYDKNGKRVKKGYLYEGYSLGIQMGKSADLKKQQADLYRKEIAEYPDSYEAKLNLLLYEISKADSGDRKKFYDSANKIIANKFYTDPGNMAFTNLTTMGYLIMGEKSRLDSLREVIKERYPESEAGYELRIDDITGLKDTVKMVEELEHLIEGETRENRPFLVQAHQALFDYYGKKGNKELALSHLAYLSEKFTPYTPKELKRQARVLYDNSLALDVALALAQKSLSYADTFPVSLIRYFPETGYLPSFVSRDERASSVKEVKGQLTSLISLIHFKQHDTAMAKKLMDEALGFSQDNETLKNAGEFYSETKNYEGAFKVYEKIAYDDPQDTLSYRSMAANYRLWKGTDKGLEDIEMRIKEHWMSVMTAQLKKEVISKPLPEVLRNFVDLKGKPVSPSMIKNKIVIMDFWATWCVPCMHAMPYMEAAYQKFKNDPDVVFMIVNSGSQNELSDAQNWWGNKQYNFPVYYNKDRTIGEKMGFNLIPATFIIDQDQNIRFKTLGFEGPGMTRKIEAAINFLKKKGGQKK